MAKFQTNFRSILPLCMLCWLIFRLENGVENAALRDLKSQTIVLHNCKSIVDKTNGSAKTLQVLAHCESFPKNLREIPFLTTHLLADCPWRLPAIWPIYPERIRWQFKPRMLQFAAKNCRQLAILPTRFAYYMPRLQSVLLDNLPIRELPAQLFHGLHALRHVTIRNCRRLRTVPASLLSPPNRVSLVGLERIDLSHLDVNTAWLHRNCLFAGHDRLTHLTVRHNSRPVRLVPPNLARHSHTNSQRQPHLQQLHYESGRLLDTELNAHNFFHRFNTSGRLASFSLRGSLRGNNGNNGATVTATAVPTLLDLSSLTSLTRLDVSHNRVAGRFPDNLRLAGTSRQQPQTFPDLRVALLQHNRITDLAGYTVAYSARNSTPHNSTPHNWTICEALPRLILLDLRHNQLLVVARDWTRFLFQPVRRTYLLLHGNRLHCNCESRWMRRLLLLEKETNAAAEGRRRRRRLKRERRDAARSFVRQLDCTIWSLHTRSKWIHAGFSERSGWGWAWRRRRQPRRRRDNALTYSQTMLIQKPLVSIRSEDMICLPPRIEQLRVNQMQKRGARPAVGGAFGPALLKPSQFIQLNQTGQSRNTLESRAAQPEEPTVIIRPNSTIFIEFFVISDPAALIKVFKGADLLKTIMLSETRSDAHTYTYTLHRNRETHHSTHHAFHGKPELKRQLVKFKVDYEEITPKHFDDFYFVADNRMDEDSAVKLRIQRES